jgi:hypothetical protein
VRRVRDPQTNLVVLTYIVENTCLDALLQGICGQRGNVVLGIIRLFSTVVRIQDAADRYRGDGGCRARAVYEEHRAG